MAEKETDGSLKVGSAWEYPGRCTWGFDGKRWLMSALWALAEDLPVQEMPVSGLRISGMLTGIGYMRDFVEHMRNVNAVDMQYPVIMDQDGQIMDGRHRIARALLEGHQTIKFVRFEVNPQCDYEVTE